MSRWWWKWRQISRKLWVRTTLIGVLSVVAALLAAVVDAWIPWEFPAFVPVEAIESLLGIIASSMLAVTTFSLGVMTSAYGSASSNVTPRATKLLMEDTITQSVLASFVGSFIFSIVGMIVLRFGAYGERGRVVLFIVTIWVMAMIVVNLLRWINYLTTFGRMGETMSRVEQATRSAMEMRLEQPYLGGQPWLPDHPLPAHAVPVTANAVGYVQHIDMPALLEAVREHVCKIYIYKPPGRQVFCDSPLAWIVPSNKDCQDGAAKRDAAPDVQTLADAVRASFTLGADRNFDQDPRFGLAVMCEIASRALSPATNDPGTALDVIARTTRLMSFWGQQQHERQQQGDSEVEYPEVYVPPLQSSDMFDDAFMLMARDGAGLIEVQLHLQKSLAALARVGNDEFRAAARAQADLAMARAIHAMELPQDQQRLQQLVQDLAAQR